MTAKVKTKYAVKDSDTGKYYICGGWEIAHTDNPDVFTRLSQTDKPELCGRLATARSNRRRVLSKLPDAKVHIEIIEIVETSIGIMEEDESAIRRMRAIAKVFASQKNKDAGIFLETIEEALHKAAATEKWFRYVGVWRVDRLTADEVKRYSTARILKMNNRNVILRCMIFNNISDFVTMKLQSADAMIFLYDFDEDKVIVA